MNPPSTTADRYPRRNYLGYRTSLGFIGLFACASTFNDSFAGEPEAKVLETLEKPSVKVIDGRKDEVDYKAISKAEWKKRLTSQQYKVCREQGTERAYSGLYYDSKADGIYRCVCCESPLFDSAEKFDSKTGWPSFWEPSEKKMVGESVDHLLGYPRTEVHCNRCDAHLGHVFTDAPQTPTGLRYCINSVCLEFVPREKVEKEKVK